MLPSRLTRYFSSIISSRIILNIRQFANGQRTSADTGLTAVGRETTLPVSRLHFANDSQTISVVDAELRLY